MFPFFESIALRNGKILNLVEHQSRINHCFKIYYPGYIAINLADIEIISDQNKFELVKLKFQYNHNEYSMGYSKYTTQRIKEFFLYPLPSFIYNFKFSDRLFFDSLKCKIPIDSEYIFLQNNLLTDTSYSNLIFQDGNSWVTPKECLLNGCMREKLIKEKKISERSITTEDLKYYSGFKLINALNEFESSPLYPIDIISHSLIKL
ncbi:MAG: aminotransferase class IV [Saprospiraceae bacterium]